LDELVHDYTHLTLNELKLTCINFSPRGSGSTDFACRFPDFDTTPALDSSFFSSAS